MTVTIGNSNNREFKVYDATVAKTSLKIASSSFSIYFPIMSVCLTFESQQNYPGTEFRGARKEYSNLHLSVHVLCKAREMVISRRRFVENLKEMHGIKKCT